MSLNLQRSMLKMLGTSLIQMLGPGGSVANQLQPGPGEWLGERLEQFETRLVSALRFVESSTIFNMSG